MSRAAADSPSWDRLRLIARLLIVATLLAGGMVAASGQGPDQHRVLQAGLQPDDARLGPPTDLNGYFPFQVPDSKAAWQARARELRQRVRISTGMFPMPEKTPLNAVIHGKVQRNGFTIEKVYFESVPGHYVSGLLFRPDDGKTGPRPAVLSPHGHGGRQYDYGKDKMKALLADGSELYAESGRYPKLSRCVQLARMGCVTFIFDMLGYVDSQQISYQLAHRYAKRRPDFENNSAWGFYSPQAEARLQSIFGLQSWNCVRSLDFLASLPDVDAKRMAVTGGSGGGTQTIILGAIDDRHIAGFPNGMVSTAMQGGCTCENCSLLRIGTGNVELAALFAPRPQGMTAASDWTRDMMTKGYPQLQQLYEMLDVPNNVYCEEMLQYPHNYNAVTRKIMYEWMNTHLQLGLETPIVEQDYVPLTEQEYTVWNEQHPVPEGGDDYERRLLQQLNDRDLTALDHHAPETDTQTQNYLSNTRTAWQTLIGRSMPLSSDVQRTKGWKEVRAGYIEFGDLISLTTTGEQLPLISLYPKSVAWNQQVVLWVDGQGKAGMFPDGRAHPDVLRLIDAGYSVVGMDLFGQGEFTTNGEALTTNPTVSNPRQFAGYTYCYNDTLFARRVHDILTVTAWINGDEHSPKALHAVGVNGGGPLLAAARVIAAEQISAAAIDTGGFRFAELTDWKDARFLPGAVKYGDVPTLLALSMPQKLWIGGEAAIPAIVESACRHHGSKPADVIATSGGRLDTLSAAVDFILQQ